MKPLDNLINVEKAKLLHELFPQEIPALLEYTDNMCLTIQEDEQLIRSQWENGLLTVEAWLSFVEEDERYGFFGKVRHSYNGIQLSMIPTLKHSLKFHRTKGEFYMFLAPQIISDSEDYEGCSGAPILDSQCRIVALACAVHTGTRIIYGFPIQKCKELLDYALQTGML